MTKILFVCHGNICRSTMAQYVFLDMVKKEGLGNKFHIDSAGTSSEEYGNTVHYGTRNKLREVGIPCGDHRAVKMSKKDYKDFDFLIGMDHWNMKNMERITGGDPEGKMYMLLDFTDRAGQDIADPWYTGDFDPTYRDVSQGCAGFLQYLKDNYPELQG